MNRRSLAISTAVLLAVALLASVGYVIRQSVFGPKTVIAYFSTATAVYPGDEVRVSGVKVGTIESIQPQGTQAKMVLKVDGDVPVPADANAVIVAPNLIAARYVQLTPAYRTTGPTMADGAEIPLERTAVPVEWDEVKDQLTRLAAELGPTSDVSGTSVSRFIDSAADAMDGNGEKLRETLAQLSGVGRILADGSGNIVDIIKNLQTFVTALRDSNTQIVAFQNRLATLTSVVDNSRTDLDAALTELAVAVGEVQRFVAGSRNQTSEQVQRLANVTQNLVDHRTDLENVLHVAPNAFANGYNIYSPDTGSAIGQFVLANMSSPIQFICGAIGSIENTTAPETAKLCAQYLGPAMRLLNFNYLPFPINPYLSRSYNPANVVYAEAGLAPGGAGPKPAAPEVPPAVSAYTGAGDVAPPPGFGPAGPPQPDRLPAFPSPALFPGAPIPTVENVPPASPPNISDMLLPAEAAPAPGTPTTGQSIPPPPPPGNSLNGVPLPAPAEGTPGS